MKGAILVGDVDFAGVVAGRLPGCLRRSRVEPGERFVRADHHMARQVLGTSAHRSRAVDHPADRGPLISDDHRIGHHGAQPVEEVQDFGARNAGEQVLVAPENPTTSWGKTGPTMMRWS